MNTLFIDNRMGISATKLLGALIDTMEAPEIFVRHFNEMGFSGVRMELRADALNGITGSKVSFTRVSAHSVEEYYAQEEANERAEERRQRGLFSRRRQDEPVIGEHMHS